MKLKGSRLPCFTGVTKPTPGKDKESNPTSSNPSKSVSLALRERFQLGLTDAQVGEHMRKLVQSSANNSFTRLYDMFQVSSTLLSKLIKF